MINLKLRSMVMSVGTAGVLAATALGLSAAPAAASTVGTCWSMDNAPGETGMCYQSYNQFTEAAGLHSAPGGGTVTSTGSAGDLFYATGFQQASTSYHCDNGVNTRYWYQGTDQNTGATGWVADCYLNWEGP